MQLPGPRLVAHSTLTLLRRWNNTNIQIIPQEGKLYRSVVAVATAHGKVSLGDADGSSTGLLLLYRYTSLTLLCCWCMHQARSTVVHTTHGCLR